MHCGSGGGLAEPGLVYLSDLLAGRLVLGSLAQVFDPLVFGQEVLLLRHFLPSLHPLVQQLPEETVDV